jgi:hypothetical protein
MIAELKGFGSASSGPMIVPYRNTLDERTIKGLQKAAGTLWEAKPEGRWICDRPLGVNLISISSPGGRANGARA